MAEKEKTVMTMDTVSALYNKKFGAGTIVSGGGVMRDAPRIPSMIFPLDFIMGGGLPLWRSSCAWGPPGSGKSTLAIRFMIGVSQICFNCFRYLETCKCKGAQRRMRSALLDTEGTVDSDWAEAQGLRKDDYVYASPDTGEHAVDIADSLVQADDCALVVVDSLANIQPSAELEESAEDMFIGLQARLVAKMFRKVTQRIIQERRKGKPVAAIFINQIRAKIGGYGNDNEEQPTGYSGKFAYSMSMRVGARAINASKEPDKVDKEKGGLPLVARTSIRINKHKVRVLGLTAEYDIVKADSYQGKPKGTVLDQATLIKYARDYGVIAKQGNSYLMGKMEFKTLTELDAFLAENPVTAKLLQQVIIDAAKKVENGDET